MRDNDPVAAEKARRDALFACGCCLVGLGLVPFLHARSIAHYDDSIYTHDYLDELVADRLRISSPFTVNALTGTALDLVTCVVALAFALLGVGAMFLSCLLLPAHSMRACLKIVGVPLAVLTTGSAVLVVSFYADTDVGAAWRASAQYGFDVDTGIDISISTNTGVDSLKLERDVNDAFCGALGHQVCTDGSVRDAQELFSTQWNMIPTAINNDNNNNDTDNSNINALAPDSIAAVCRARGADTVVNMGDYNTRDSNNGVTHNVLESLGSDSLDVVCRVCRDVTHDADTAVVSPTVNTKSKESDVKPQLELGQKAHLEHTFKSTSMFAKAALQLIRSPSPDAVRWCGTYLVSRNALADPSASPFQQHRDEVLHAWRKTSRDVLRANVVAKSLTLGVRLLMLLIGLSLPVLTTIVRWLSDTKP